MREEEKSIQDFEALHSSLISLDKSNEEQYNNNFINVSSEIAVSH